MKTDAIYGASPVDLGLIDIYPCEFMFWLYCPIKLPGSGFVIPSNLDPYRCMLPLVREDCRDRWDDSYVYITAKTLHCTPDNPGNRPGWHSDGFLTDDLNYIWADANPTVFWENETRVGFTADHTASLREMDAVCEPDVDNHRRYPKRHLLRLDQTVLHKVDTNIEAGIRTFVKISVSRHRYALAGNSINHALPGWEYKTRGVERNCPIEGSF